MYGDSIDEDNQRVRHRSDANGGPSSSGELLLPAPAMRPDWSRASLDPAWPTAAPIVRNGRNLAPDAPFRAELRCTELSTALANMVRWLFAHVLSGQELQVV